MARLGETMGWASNPFYKAFDSNRSAIVSGFAGIGSDPRNPAAGFSRGFAQGMPMDQQRSDQQVQEQERQAQINQTAAFLREKGAEDLAAAVEGGMTTGADAFNQWYSAQNQQVDPFTLGKGEIRYDGQGNVIAQGPEGGPDTLITNNIGGTDKFYDTMDAKLAEQTAAVIESGYNAQSNNIRIGELERLLGPGGAPQGAQGVMVQAAGSLGIPVEGLDDLQAAQALISQMVPGQRPAGSGTMSDADLALFKQSLPSIINQPGGNQKVLQTMKAINEYTIQQAQIAQMVANREISPAEGRAMQAQVPNPLRGGTPAASGLPPGVTIREIP